MTKLNSITIVLLLVLSIFSFTLTTQFENTVSFDYEILLDDTNESDDKEESQKQLFVLAKRLTPTAITTLTDAIFSNDGSRSHNTSDPHFRPPIFA